MMMMVVVELPSSEWRIHSSSTTLKLDDFQSVARQVWLYDGVSCHILPLLGLIHNEANVHSGHRLFHHKKWTRKVKKGITDRRTLDSRGSSGHTNAHTHTVNCPSFTMSIIGDVGAINRLERVAPTIAHLHT